MGTQSTRGFTIIETMLFLAISGVLIVAMIAGTGAAINIQRYRDAVETFKSLLQDQYSALSSVDNQRDDTWNCTPLAVTEAEGSEIRGQSDCMVLGRYVTVVGDKISLYTVIGAGSASGGNDITNLATKYVLNVSSVDQETMTMEWGTQIAWPKDGIDAKRDATPRSFGILLVRSPDSGQIYTFTSDVVADEPSAQTLQSMVVAGTGTAGAGQTERYICVNSNGLFVSDDQSIYISQYATGPSSIESRSDGVIESLGGGNTQCAR